MDKYYMKLALKEAIKGLGKVNPNPLVGAIIVKKNKILSKGYHEIFGGLHAEVNAINRCTQEELEDATIYVNLEPCSHYGKTPPCVDLIIKSKIKKCVIGIKDPNPLVSGNGIKKLKDFGIEVIVGVLEEKCRKINRVFFKYIVEKVPFVFLKVAITLDGKIATRNFSSKWISNEKAREKVQQYRNNFSSVLVGANTIKKDNPSLKCHLKGRNPYRIIFDKNLSINNSFRVIKENFDKKTIIVTKIENKESVKLKKMQENKVKFIFYKEGENLKNILTKIGSFKIDSILVEGGGEIISYFFKENLFDSGEIFIAPKIIGDEKAVSFVKGFNIKDIKESMELKNIKINKYDENIGIEFDRNDLKCLQD